MFLIIFLTMFVILFCFRNGMNYFYRYGRILSKFLTIFAVYTLVIYLSSFIASSFFLVLIDQQRNKLPFASSIFASKISVGNAEYFAKAVILYFISFFFASLFAKRSNKQFIKVQVDSLDNQIYFFSP